MHAHPAKSESESESEDPRSQETRRPVESALRRNTKISNIKVIHINAICMIIFGGKRLSC